MRERTIERVDEILTYCRERGGRRVDIDGLGFWNLLTLGCLIAESLILREYTEEYYQKSRELLKTRWEARASQSAVGEKRA